MRAPVALALALFIAACGGDSKKSPDASLADAPNQIDATPDGPSQICASVTPGTLDVIGTGSASSSWGAPVTGDVGDGQPLKYQIQVYSGVESSLMGTFDLSAGKQANYSSCAICVLAFEQDSMGQTSKVFFQVAGSITLTEDPFTAGHLVGSVTDLKLQEVTIDQSTFASTPVPNGACGNFGAFSVDHDAVPNAYTCTHSTWTDGATCDCGCGLQDPDCFSGSNTVAGCTGTQGCGPTSTCADRPANDTCAAATTLTLGTAVTGTTLGAPNDYNAGLEGATCTGYAQVGGDVVYQVTLAANTAYKVALTGLDAGFDGSVSLVGPGTAATVCGATITTCVAGADAGAEGADETFTYTPTAAGTYYVIVDSFYGPGREAGAFTLTVSAN